MNEYRKLATVQTISKIEPHSNADSLEIATILGWKVCVKKGEFKEKDKVVYCEVDSILPERPEFEFLKTKGYRIKAIRLRGQVSMGICFPLSTLKVGENEIVSVDGKPYLGTLRDVTKDNVFKTEAFEGILLEEGLDVTELLGIKKFEPYIPAQLNGIIKGNFPSFLRKTDSLRLQSYPDVINEFKDLDVYVGIKIDGSSSTFYCKNGEFGVCSRNLELQREENNTLWQVASQFNLEEKLKKYGKNIAIQGECYGSGIQKNKLGITGKRLAVFDIFDIDNRKYLDFQEMVSVAKELELETVPYIYQGKFAWNSIDELIGLSNAQKYDNKSPAEGIVIRPTSEIFSKVLGERLAIKVISDEFLLKYGE